MAQEPSIRALKWPLCKTFSSFSAFPGSLKWTVQSSPVQGQEVLTHNPT